MTAKSVSQGRQVPTLGIVLLDGDHYTSRFGKFEPSDVRGLGCLPPGWFECPATWPVPTAYAVAQGADPQATLDSEPRAITALTEAIAILAPYSELIITDCGLFWGARAKAQAEIAGTALISGLDLLALAEVMTSGPIGVLTISEPTVERLMTSHPLKERVRIVGLQDQPTWRTLSGRDFASAPKWTREALRKEFTEVFERELRTGRLKDVGALVIECTCFPQFRDELRQMTSVPILDVATIAKAILS